jgi:hypothetical protein
LHTYLYIIIKLSKTNRFPWNVINASILIYRSKCSWFYFVKWYSYSLTKTTIDISIPPKYLKSHQIKKQRSGINPTKTTIDISIPPKYLKSHQIKKQRSGINPEYKVLNCQARKGGFNVGRTDSGIFIWGYVRKRTFGG